jgi:hypothetical protein
MLDAIAAALGGGVSPGGGGGEGGDDESGSSDSDAGELFASLAGLAHAPRGNGLAGGALSSAAAAHAAAASAAAAAVRASGGMATGARSPIAGPPHSAQVLVGPDVAGRRSPPLTGRTFVGMGDAGGHVARNAASPPPATLRGAVPGAALWTGLEGTVDADRSRPARP